MNFIEAPKNNRSFFSGGREEPHIRRKRNAIGPKVIPGLCK